MEYGAEVFHLNKTEVSDINKKMASFYKRSLNLDSYVPTDWILWEADQTKIEWAIAKRKTAYWWKIISSPINTLQQKIIKYNKSLFRKTLTDNQLIKQLGKQNNATAPTTPHAMKIAIKDNLRTLRIKEMDGTHTEPNHIAATTIKPNPEIEEHLLNDRYFTYEDITIQGNILRLRAQTYGLSCDVHPKTNTRKCTLCQEPNSLRHITQHCETLKTEITEYTEAIETTINKHNKKRGCQYEPVNITHILSMTATDDMDTNIDLLKITTFHISEICKLQQCTAQQHRQPATDDDNDYDPNDDYYDPNED
jgi:hypothetical protein